MPPRLPLAIVALIAAGPSPAARVADAPQRAAAELKQHLDSLSAFDYSTRMNAARMIRRAAAPETVQMLTDAARSHPDQFVRYRALVLLTAFNDAGTPDLMRSLLGDRNDRVREVAYRWFERRPNPALAQSLIGALDTEQSEFVRPALVRAVAALPPSDTVQRALLAEVGRGLDFFRSAVIDALGEHRAEYALDAIAAVAATDGPLQDDAVLALGRIGHPRARGAMPPVRSVGPDVAAAVQAAECLLGDVCAARVDWLTSTARHPSSRPEVVRAAVAALGAVAGRDVAARNALLELAGVPGRVHGEAALAMASWALRQPQATVEWMAELLEASTAMVLDLLREGFERLEEDFAEEQFYAAARAAYWAAADESTARRIAAALIDTLDF